MSDKDILEEEKEETPSDSQPEKETPAEEAKEPVKEDVKKPASEAENVWGGLSGSTQDRIVELVRRAKQAEVELEKERLNKAQPKSEEPETEPPSDAELQAAVKRLKEVGGVVTKEDLQFLQNRLILDREHDRLKDKFDGSDGRPKYVPEEVEDYARTHYFGGNLEAAFWEMYRDEMVDAEVKKRTAKTTYTEKPTTSVKVGEQPLTLASLKERLSKPDGAEWWAKNREKIEPLLPKLTQA